MVFAGQPGRPIIMTHAKITNFTTPPPVGQPGRPIMAHTKVGYMREKKLHLQDQQLSLLEYLHQSSSPKKKRKKKNKFTKVKKINPASVT